MAYNEHLAARIRSLLESKPNTVERKMFGGLAFLINGHLAVAASGQGGLLVRVDPAKSDEIVSSSSAEVMIMRGREMPGWLHVGDENLSDAGLSKWVEVAATYTNSLPTKA